MMKDPDVDSTGIAVRSLVVKEYRHAGIKVLLMRCTSKLLSLMTRSELLGTVGKEHVFPDIVDAMTITVSND